VGAFYNTLMVTLLRGISNKREYLARAFEQVGVIGLLERAAAARPPALLVLTYHRIAEPGSDCFYNPIISATAESFRAQIQWLHNHVRILSLEDVLLRIEDGAPWNEPAALVTFDDGYRDNFDAAVPILREFGVPATFFIATAFLESGKLPWWDYVAYVIKKTDKALFNVSRSQSNHQPPFSIDLNQASRDAVIMRIVRAFLDHSIPEEAWFLDQLAAAAEVAVDEPGLSRQLFTDWEQLRRLSQSDPCFSIGSHSHSHPELSRLLEQSQCDELTLSKQILESRLGRKVHALAYPFGWSGAYDRATKRAAAQAGYRLAFTGCPGVNRPGMLDAFEISRLGVGSADSLTLLRARAALLAAFGLSFL
jgi:peptidoglycan/xylan/chitin deacetylase (PgdA/CDA1 family)